MPVAGRKLQVVHWRPHEVHSRGVHLPPVPLGNGRRHRQDRAQQQLFQVPHTLRRLPLRAVPALWLPAGLLNGMLRSRRRAGLRLQGLHACAYTNAGTTAGANAGAVANAAAGRRTPTQRWRHDGFPGCRCWGRPRSAGRELVFRYARQCDGLRR